MVPAEIKGKEIAVIIVSIFVVVTLGVLFILMLI